MVFSLFLKKFGIVSLILVIAACNVKTGNSSSQKSSMGDSLVFTGCQDQIKMVPGNVAIIKLEATQGTGYQWLVKEPSPLLEQLNPDKLEFLPSENKDVVAGGAGYQVLTFKAVEAGEATISLEYKRTFESGVEKSCVIKFTIGK